MDSGTLPKPLSPQQKILMQHIVDGLTQKEIELKMGIKLSTIRKYMKSIRKKYKCKSTFQCVALLVARGELDVTVLEYYTDQSANEVDVPKK